MTHQKFGPNPQFRNLSSNQYTTNAFRWYQGGLDLKICEKGGQRDVACGLNIYSLMNQDGS